MFKTPIITWPWSLGLTVGRQWESPEIQLSSFSWWQCVTIPKTKQNQNFFRYQISTVLYPILFLMSNLFTTESKTIQKWKEFWNREVCKLKRLTLPDDQVKAAWWWWFLMMTILMIVILLMILLMILTPEVGHWHFQGSPHQSKAPLVCEHPPTPPCRVQIMIPPSSWFHCLSSWWSWWWWQCKSAKSSNNTTL